MYDHAVNEGSDAQGAHARRRRWAMLAAGLGLVVAALCVEGAVRLIGQVDERGQFLFRGRVVRPFVLPSEDLSRRLEQLGPEVWKRDYHAVLGWAPNPEDPEVNALGARSTREVDLLPGAGIYRVATFGDSFVFGDGLAPDRSIAAQLEALFAEAGLAVEVLNFGARGYGMDQALLRYRETGAAAKADFVVVGLQTENMWRNLNLLRPIYHPQTLIPYAKPRFALEGGELRLLNVPVPPPETLPALLADLGSWELLPYENAFRWEDYARPLWRRSRALSLAIDVVAGGGGEGRLRHREEAIALAVAILSQFREEVTANGADFLLVHLPDLESFRNYALGRPVKDEALLDAIEQQQPVLEPYAELQRTAPFYGGDGFHYGEKGTLAIARSLFDAIRPSVEARASTRH